MHIFLKEFLNKIENVFPDDFSVFKNLEIPKKGYGDLAWPCFVLAKKFKKSPNIIALELSEKLNSLFEEWGIFKATGGYLNFTFNDKKLFECILTEYKNRGDKFGYEKSKNIKVAIDFSSPNIAKPFSIGHLRSTSIGNSLYRILKKNGYTPIGINHLGDWGTQFGKLIYAVKNWWEKDLNDLTIKELFNLYVKFHKEAENNPEIEDMARKEFKLLETGDTNNRKLWKFICELSLSEFKRIYDRLGVEFDYYLGESFYEDKLEDVINILKRKGILKESNGAFIVDLEDEKLPPALIKKTDGTTLYLTRDLASAIYRKEVLKADYLLYVVGSEQKLHFQQLKAVLKKLGYDWYKNIIHVDFGLFRFKGEKMSTRKGKVIFMEDVLNEAKNKVMNIINEKNPDIKDKERIAEIIGIGAIIFGDLMNDRIKNVVFDWESMLSFEGDTGPYVQYAHTRCNSLLKKARIAKIDIEFSVPHTIELEERELLREIIYFNIKELRAIRDYKPHYIADALLEITKKFNRFYKKCPVINADDNIKKYRLSIVFLIKTILTNGLYILGIKAPEYM